MKKGIKQIISLLLAAVMILSLGATPVQAAGRGQQGWSSVTYGADESKAEEAAVPQEETSAENEAEAPAEEPEAPAEEPAAPAEENEVPAEEPAAPVEETEVPVEEPAAPAEPAVSYPAVTLAGATEGGVTVRVEAPEGALPEGVYMTLRDVAAQDVQAKVDETIDGVILAAVDITFNNAANKEIQPNGNVSVFIKAPELAESAAEDLGILHIDEENKVAEELTEAENAVEVKAAAADEVAFVNDAFSIYVVVASGENARLTVNFKNGSEIIKTMYVKKKDITDGNLNQVLYDPGVPVVAGKKFLGWTDNQNWASLPIDQMKAEAMTINGVRSAVTTTLNGGVADGTDANYYAMMVYCFELYYQDEYGNTFKTENVLSATGSGTTTVECPYTLTGGTATQNFIGWKVKGTENPVYKNGTEITISANTTLLPAIGNGRWLWFDSNAGGAGVSEATYTAPKFVPEGDNPGRPDDPTRPGYTFNGWYNAPEGGQPFNFDEPLPVYTPSEGDEAEDSYVWAYAHWTPNETAKYKVVIWAQKVTDDKNAADEDKTYDYVATYEVENAVAGTVLDETELGQSTNKYFEKGNAFFGANELKHGSKAFEYNRFEVVRGIGADKNGVNPDDSTVVNVYYDRALFTIIFIGNGSGSYDYYYPVDEGENVYGLIDGEHVPLTVTVSNKRIQWTKVAGAGSAGNAGVPSNITQVKYSTKSNGSLLYDDYIANVSDLRNKSGGVTLINLPVGETGVKAYYKNGTMYLFTTASSSTSNYCSLRWTIVADISYAYNGSPYTGQLYAKTTLNGEAYTGLYGQTLAQNGYEWPTPAGSAEAWQELSWLEAFRGNLFGLASLGFGTDVGGIPNTIIAKPASNAATSTIIFWFEDKDVAGQYNEVDRVRFYFGTDSRYNITERILGAVFNGYQWTGSESMPSTWSYNVGNDGFTTDERGNNTYMHIRYKRAEYSIRFMLGNQELKHIDNVKFDQLISSYESQAPTDIPHDQDEFVEDNWYEDPEGKTKVNWDTRMPAGDKLVYAVVRNSQYHVFVDMDGGTLPAGQRNQFWENWGKTIDKTNFMRAEKTNDQGDSYTLVGYYLDEELTRPWDFNIPLSEAYLWYKYRDTADAEDPARRSEFFGEGNYDSNYPQCVGIFRLWAKWRDDNIVGGLHIRYTNPSDVGEDKVYTYEDEMHYEDMADVIAAQAPAERYWPDGKRFDGWQLTEGKVYQPGDMFIADNDDAVTADDNQRWITLTAVYVDQENRTPTHITWYKNDGSGDNYDASPDLGINEAWPVYGTSAYPKDAGKTIPEREGYIFMGWAKDVETPVDANGNPMKDPETGAIIINTSTAKTAADFLEYKDGKFYLPGTTTEVSYVAADEVKPYEGLYAIWEEVEYFYVYHSSTAKLTAYLLDDYNDSIWNVPTGYLYGGCYKSYGGVTAANIEAAKNNAKKSVGTAVAVTGAEPYTGEVFKTGLKKHWMPGTIKGANEALQKNVVYYIKEVPDAYLDNFTQFIYDKDTNKVAKMFFLTATDDTSYNRIYFKITTAEDHEAKLCTSFTFEEKKTGATSELKVGDTVFKDTLKRGYLGYSDASDLLVENATYTIQPYWVTPDGVEVPGKTRTLAMGNCTNTSEGIHLP